MYFHQKPHTQQSNWQLGGVKGASKIHILTTKGFVPHISHPQPLDPALERLPSQKHLALKTYGTYIQEKHGLVRNRNSSLKGLLCRFICSRTQQKAANWKAPRVYVKDINLLTFRHLPEAWWASLHGMRSRYTPFLMFYLYLTSIDTGRNCLCALLLPCWHQCRPTSFLDSHSSLLELASKNPAPCATLMAATWSNKWA